MFANVQLSIIVQMEGACFLKVGLVFSTCLCSVSEAYSQADGMTKARWPGFQISFYFSVFPFTLVF